MEKWILVDTLIILVYSLQHTVLTTKVAVKVFNFIFPENLWNIIYSIISVITIFIGFYYWEPSNITIFRLTPGSFTYHISTILLSLSFFLFFYCFKYTTSFWQWIGIKQIICMVNKKEMPKYYIVRKEGIKKYVRFPHHFFLMLFFWFHPVMTYDTLLLAIGSSIYLYLGTYHQDLRGMSFVGSAWSEYRKDTNLLFPNLIKIYKDLRKDKSYFF